MRWIMSRGECGEGELSPRTLHVFGKSAFATSPTRHLDQGRSKNTDSSQDHRLP